MARQSNQRSEAGSGPDTIVQRAVHDVVVSYSRSDADRVRPVVRRLEEAGVAVWLDRDDIAGARLWGAEIAAAIDSCKVLLFMASSASIVSKGVIREVAVAYDAEKAILPLHLEPITLPN